MHKATEIIMHQIGKLCEDDVLTDTEMRDELDIIGDEVEARKEAVKALLKNEKRD